MSDPYCYGCSHSKAAHDSDWCCTGCGCNGYSRDENERAMLTMLAGLRMMVSTGEYDFPWARDLVKLLGLTVKRMEKERRE